MKKLVFALLFSFVLTGPGWSDDSTGEEAPFSSKTKKVLLWKGDVVGVYKNRVWIKIRIYRNQKISRYSASDIQTLLKTAKEFPVYQKGTDIQQGVFLLRDSVVEEKKPKAKEYEVVLSGDYLPTPDSKMPNITTDAYISSFIEEDFYVEPDAFFKGRFTPPRKTVIHPKDKKEMVLVGRGLFLYGQGTDPSSDSFNPYFLEPKTATLKEIPSFYIDKYEVTNSEYDTFLKQTNTKPPAHWIQGKYPLGEDEHPVNYLTYREVEQYANWVGKRIPTEFEWEKAAKGPGVIEYQNRDETLRYQVIATKYPFGDDFDPVLCNARESKVGKTLPVTELSTEGASPYGAIGMCGNVSEWTSSNYQVYPGHHLKSFSFGNMFKVIRGGSFSESAKQCSVTVRSFGGIPNLYEDRRAGFRLVMDYRD